MIHTASTKILNFKTKKKEEEKVVEWNPAKKWNPFNSYKLLAHVERWRNIKRGRPIPAPILITVDPTNICNLNCIWCNAEFIRKHRNLSLSKKCLISIADFLSVWGRKNFNGRYGVEAVCIAGGGEPLLNEHTAEFIDRLSFYGIEIGLVTNGSLIDKYIDSLSQCTWVGVSVDAGKAETFNQLKKPKQKDMFHKILENMTILIDYSKRHNAKLGAKHPSYGVSYKFLLHKKNIDEVFEATKIAKEIGCKNIHFRPAGTPWDKLGTEKEIKFSENDIKIFNEQIKMSLDLDDENFSVYGVTHKFNSQFERANYFNRCYAIFMTCVIQPPSSKKAHPDSFVFGLCCDRRGDKKLELGKNIQNVFEIEKLWGGKQHWKIFDNIHVEYECPRCTYQPHNQIYEQVILNDSMTYKFI